MTSFICSLPRSKTGWIANFLTCGPSFCIHELSGYVHRLSDYPSVLASFGTKHVSVADSANIFGVDRLVEMFPDCRLVVVRRNRMDVQTSIAKLGFDCSSVLSILEEDLKRIQKIHASRTLVLDFEPLDARALWEFCAPEEPLNELRLSMLETLNVQILPGVLNATVQDNLPRVKKEGKLWSDL